MSIYPLQIHRVHHGPATFHDDDGRQWRHKMMMVETDWGSVRILTTHPEDNIFPMRMPLGEVRMVDCGLVEITRPRKSAKHWLVAAYRWLTGCVTLK